MHEASYKVVGGNNPGRTFRNNNLPIEEEESKSVEFSIDERIVELERLLKEMKDKLKMVSLLILIIFTISNLTNHNII